MMTGLKIITQWDLRKYIITLSRYFWDATIHNHYNMSCTDGHDFFVYHIYAGCKFILSSYYAIFNWQKNVLF